MNKYVVKTDDKIVQQVIEKIDQRSLIGQAKYGAMMMEEVEGKDKDQTPDTLPSLLSDALSVSFDKHVGHDYMEQSEDRFEYYNRSESKISFDLDFISK